MGGRTRRLKLCTGTRPTPGPVHHLRDPNLHGTEETFSGDVSGDREISRVPSCVSFVLTLQCPNAGMSLEWGNQRMRWVGMSKLRPKCVDAGGGDAELRDSSNMWTKETLTTGVRPSNSMIGLAVPPQIPSAWNKENMSSKMMFINGWRRLTN